jgi:hypothetical protein
MLVPILTVLVVLAAAPASGDKARRAEALFREGRALLKADLPQQACPRFRQSHEAEPALGTLLNLADCEERIGALVQAWLHFNDAAAWADRNREVPRADVARERASVLKGRLSWLALTAEKPVNGLAVRVNDFSTELGATSQSVPVNAGEVLVVATAPGMETYSAKVKVGPQSTVAFKIPALVDPSFAAMPPPAPAPENNARELSDLKDTGPSDAPVESRLLTPAPLMTAEQTLVASPQSRAPRSGAYALMAGGGAVLVAGVIGLGVTLNAHDRAMRQQPGGPDYGNPTVTRQQFEQLQWAYPLSWVATVVGTTALLGGATWAVVPMGAGVAVQGEL